MDLIKSGSYSDMVFFFAKTCATTKISTVARYHVVLAALLLKITFKSQILNSCYYDVVVFFSNNTRRYMKTKSHN